MVELLCEETLKTGEKMECVMVTPPQDDYHKSIVSLLGHKEQQWLYQIKEALAGRAKGLETRFYLGLVGNEPICNIATAEYDRVGILGHVYTKPEHRRKGACALLMKHQMEDWRQRGGVLLLETDYDTPPYWIYHRFGFRSVIPGSGFMQYCSEEGFVPKYFASAPARVVDYEWTAWPRLNLLAACLEGGVVRSVGLKVFGPDSFEEVGTILKERVDKEAEVRAKLLESETGAIVGWAFVLPEGRWPGVNLLDLFVHPNFDDSAPALLRAVELPAGKCQCYVDADSSARAAALESEGFAQEGLLKGQLQYEGSAVDVAIYSKRIREGTPDPDMHRGKYELGASSAHRLRFLSHSTALQPRITRITPQR